MSTEQLMLFGAWFLFVFTIMTVIAWVIPMFMRLKFVTALDALRDRVMDHVFNGELPLGPPVQDFLEVQDTLIRAAAARQLTLGRVIAISKGLAAAGVRQSRDKPSFANLSGPQRKLMHELQDELTTTLARYLLDGSPLGWMMHLTVPILRWRRRSTGQARLKTDDPKTLADVALVEARAEVAAERRAHRDRRRPKPLMTM
jgi:hypothetical protein